MENKIFSRISSAGIMQTVKHNTIYMLTYLSGIFNQACRHFSEVRKLNPTDQRILITIAMQVTYYIRIRQKPAEYHQRPFAPEQIKILLSNYNLSRRINTRINHNIFILYVIRSKLKRLYNGKSCIRLTNVLPNFGPPCG